MRNLFNGKILLVGIEKIDLPILNLYSNLKVIGTSTTGTDHIDLELCKQRNIKVISLQGEREFLDQITSTAEHTIGLIIALLRNYKTALNAPYKDRNEYMGEKLSGKTLCLIGGAGRVGTQVSQIAEALGMRVYLIDTRLKDNKFLVWVGKKLGIDEENLFINTALVNSDIVSIHIPLSGNEKFFTKDHFLMMKPTAYLINTSRSRVIEDGSLLWALENAIIAGAAVDFIDDEKLLEYSKNHDNLILTNHLGGVTYEDRKLTEEFILNKINQFMENQND